MIDLREVRSVTEFQRNLRDYVSRLKRKKAPLVLTVNGRAELVVQDARSYQALLDRLEEAETMAAVREGMEQIKRSEGIPWPEARKKLLKKRTAKPQAEACATTTNHRLKPVPRPQTTG